MRSIITIKPNTDNSSVFTIHPNKAYELNLGRKKRGYVCFGSQKHYVNLELNDEISQDCVFLSQKLMDELHLPDYVIYEISTNKNEIIIGPYIGLLLSEEDNKFTTSRLKKMMIYVKEYSKLHGAVVVFALDKVDMANRLIEGYCYNPVNNCWQRGVFPYPSSIYRTIGLSEKWKNHFLSTIGDKIFNSCYFSKWEMYKWFSKDIEINARIPYTLLYRSHQDILDLLSRFKKIYIKPILGLQGRRIVQLSMTNMAYIFKYRENGVNYQTTFHSLNEVSEYIKERFKNGKYLIQQAIDLMEYEDGVIDFRCVVLKNQSNMWVCKAIIGRQGDKGSIVSNISSGGAAFLAVDILEKVFSSSKEKIFGLKEKIESFAIDVCNALDEYGINCGTLGLDIGIDTTGELWLIEINNRDPDPTIALDIHDEQLYYTLKTDPLFYAKSLAGFS